MRVTVLLADVLRPAADGAAKLDVEVTDEGDVGAVLDLTRQVARCTST